MTYGSLYSQFGSKERLVEEALRYALIASGKTTAGAATLAQYVADYLAPQHRDQLGQGCPLSALACEMPRQSSGVRETFTAGLRGMLKQLSGRMDPGLKQRQRDEQALATVASLVGALVLARAVDDSELSDAILRATKKRLDG
jgi:TetR/AcrR family transcriptional repressor of nem operon